MAVKVTVDLPNLPKGTEVSIADLGVLKNGESVTLTEEQEANFLAIRGVSVKEAFKHSERYKVQESQAPKAETKEVSKETPKTEEEEVKE